ncbi:MAG: hypothetical protein NTZ34_04605 [Chloroflexi bacterium]|nr:hypothetical protein [Chloroflexota bacterium]
MKAKQDAATVVGGVTGQQRFYAVDGCVYSGLSDMADCLEHMTSDAFSHHVTSANNDFSNWVRDILNDGKLASDLDKAANADDMARIVRYRIHWHQRKKH